MARRKDRSEDPVEQALDEGAHASTSRGSKQLWKVYSKGATVLSGVLTLRLAQTTWQLATRRKPPIAPEHPDTAVREAIAWAVLSGVTAELVKIAVSRRTAQYWVRSTGNLPPGMDPLED